MRAAAIVILALQALQVDSQANHTLGPLPLLTWYSREEPPSVFSELHDFAVLDREHVALRPAYKREILIADREGHVRHRIAAHMDIQLLAAFGPHRLLYWVDNEADPRTGQACNIWSADIDDDSAQPFAACANCELIGLAALDSDRCAALVFERDPDGKKHEFLKGFDAAGAERFSYPLPMACNHLFASHDRFGLVYFGEPSWVMWFDRDGQGVDAVELDTRLSSARNYSYVGQPISCADGSLLAPISDPMQQTFALLRQFDDHGRKMRDVVMRFAPGWGLPSWWVPGPDQVPWIYDGYAFLRLGLDGVCTTEFAAPGDAERLHSATRIVIDPEGDVYALAACDHVLHVFDAGGRSLDRIPPVDRDCLGPSSFRWDPAEEPLPPAKLAWIAKGWLGPERDGLHFEARQTSDPWHVALLDPARRVVRALHPPRSSDANWTAVPSRTASDGSIAVVWRWAGELPRRPVAAWYDASGTMRGVITLPMGARRAEAAAWDGRRLAIADYLRVQLFDTRGRLVADRWLSDLHEYQDRRSGCGSGGDSTPYLDFGAGGCELWLRQGAGRLVVQRFEIP